MPTLLDLAGIDIPDTVEGLSMVGEKRRSYLYGECGEGTNASRMIHAGRHKLIYYPVGQPASSSSISRKRSQRAERPCWLTRHTPQYRPNSASASSRELYGSDEAWIKDDQLVGLPDHSDGHTRPNRSLIRSTRPALSCAAPRSVPTKSLEAP